MRLAPDALNALVELVLVLAVLAMAVKLLLLNVWRAWLFLFPTRVQLLPEASGETPPELVPWARRLQELGFVPLGAHVQKSRFQRGTRSHDFAHPGERAFATLYLSALGGPRLYLLTPLAGGGAVLTEGAPSSARVLFGLSRAGESVSVPPEVLLQTHRERLKGLAPGADFTSHGRLLAGRAWFQGPGQREIRRQSLPGLLWTLVALAMVAFLFVGGRTV
ncbi:hypothetical protein [Melittangium boletus]|uniref:Uncharacterized protein n=1 Tax=Melittangium boletus DSM 14713 TaxID=1294270 RepID=A0A250IAH9_9BACT|nr:hypothetical protein [Melittangium boletus]ATB28137.1 hypothetical protein MEBOL_001583 [Melittangium boletus DSM 14713]